MCVHLSGMVCGVHVLSAFILSGGVSGTVKNRISKITLLRNDTGRYSTTDKVRCINFASRKEKTK